MIHGNRGVVAAGHYLAAAVGARILGDGGNAIDAGVAAGFVLSLVKPHHNGMGGEVPILISTNRTRQEGTDVIAISGQGRAPRAANIEWFRSRGYDAIPGDGLLPATVPAAFGAWATALLVYGTFDLASVLGPAIELAEEGFVVDPVLGRYFVESWPRFESEWTSSLECYGLGGYPPNAGDRLRQPAWARTFKYLVDVSIRERRRGREASIASAIAAFYRGDVAEQLVAFQRSTDVLDATGARNSGLLTLDDFVDHQTVIEPAIKFNYHGVDVFKCGPWTQGPVLLQQLSLLQGFVLEEMAHNSSEYIHLVTEVAKLAFADRDDYYGDPRFVDVPLDRLLSEEYAVTRRRMIDPDSVMPVTPAPHRSISGGDEAPGVRTDHHGDTTHLDVVDRYGNMISATPSGGWFQASPVISGVGFPLGTRGQQFSLEPDHPNSLAPGKRPRVTLTPSIAFRDRLPWMAFGTPGGDYQDQWSLQFLLNMLHFDMGLQEAIDAPTFHTDHLRSSFFPHQFLRNQLVVESRIEDAVRAALGRLGHQVIVAEPWANGQVTAVALRPDGGVEGAASPRTLVPYAVGR